MSHLVELLKKQQSNPQSYPFTDKDKRQLALRRKVPTLDGKVEVEVPDDGDNVSPLKSEVVEPTLAPDSRESIRYQAKVAQVGAEMGYQIWVPRNDRARVLGLIPRKIHEKFLDSLGLAYPPKFLKTIEQIDVLWLEGGAMARAFEIEHTTAFYSGLLRMADLLALQPNMNICLHIVAQPDKRAKVLREIKRPVFSHLQGGPLYDKCSFLSYDSIDSLANEPHLSYMKHSIIEKYAKSAGK